MAENPQGMQVDPSKDLAGLKAVGQSASTPPAQPASPATMPEAVNPGSSAPAVAVETKEIAAVNSYIPGGISKDVLNPVVNPAQSDQNFPFSSGQKMHEVAQYQNFFTFPLDTYYNVFDAIYYFSDAKNRSRYSYEQQQTIISRIARAAHEFGIPIEGITDRLMN